MKKTVIIELSPPPQKDLKTLGDIEIHLEENSDVHISLVNGQIIIKPIRKEYSLEELTGGITKRNRHGEVDFGSPQGNEI